MKLNLITFILLFAVITSFSQEIKKEYKIHTIAFYNLENLFDTINDPNTKDEKSPIMQLKSERSKVYWNKINNMARVISEIGKDKTKTSPVLIGLAEIENNTVLKDLIYSGFLKAENYDFIHVDSPDWRGIDVALLYKKNLFDPIEFKTFQIYAFNENGYRVKTRDQLLVSGYLENEYIHLIINHWPSQRSGKQKSAQLREKSAELNLSIINEIRSTEPKAKILSIGDFNDDPTEPSFKKTLNTKRFKDKLVTNDLYNPFENLFKKGLGTLGYKNQLNLFDQIVLTENWMSKNKDFSSFSYYQSGIYNPSYLTTKNGKYKGYPFRSWTSNNTFSGGYSDHYPVYIFVIKEL